MARHEPRHRLSEGLRSEPAFACLHGNAGGQIHGRSPFTPPVLIFQLALMALSSRHQPSVWSASDQGVIDLLLSRDFEDACCSRIHERIQDDGLGLLKDGQFGRPG